MRQIDRFGASAEQEKWKPVADELKETCQVIRRPPVTVFPPFVRYSLLKVIFFKIVFQENIQIGSNLGR